MAVTARNSATGPPLTKKIIASKSRIFQRVPDGNVLVFSEQKFWRSTLAPGLCGKQRWELNAAFPAGVQVAGHNDGSGVSGGYSIEMKIPLSAIGSRVSERHPRHGRELCDR